MFLITLLIHSLFTCFLLKFEKSISPHAYAQQITIYGTLPGGLVYHMT